MAKNRLLIAVVSVVGALLLLGTATAFAGDASLPSDLKLLPRTKLAVFALIAKDIGIKPRELLKELGGSSIAAVAQAHGVAPAAIEQDLVQRVSDRLQHAVQKGKITQAQADQALANARTQIGQVLHKTWPKHLDGRLQRLLGAARQASER
ncbi:MAG: hypothetical protein HW388_835 [Dehalococcoidia bacterium]|nr:hypothetical protein [Dehalococcoidia bacterium]